MNLAGNFITPVAEVIKGRGLPLICATGYASVGVPGKFTLVLFCESPSMAELWPRRSTKPLVHERRLLINLTPMRWAFRQTTRNASLDTTRSKLSGMPTGAWHVERCASRGQVAPGTVDGAAAELNRARLQYPLPVKRAVLSFAQNHILPFGCSLNHFSADGTLLYLGTDGPSLLQMPVTIS